MIGWEDVFKVLSAMAPLYFALVLGYGSVKWWKIFSTEQCDAINKLVCYFTLPLFTFDFTSHIDPFHLNFHFIAADAISKLVIVLVLAFWAKCSSKGSYCWSITSFSLSTLTNALVIGVPLAKVMYGQMAVDLVVQGSVIQAIIWLTMLLFVLELRRTGLNLVASRESLSSDDDEHGKAIQMVGEGGKDVEGGAMEVEERRSNSHKPSFKLLMKKVWLKLVANPNSYACIIGLAWAFVAKRWHIEMPDLMEGSILIMSKAGIGTAMFNMGIFMALQEKLIACGATLTIIGMVLKFIAGPAAMAIGSIAMGLHGDVLRVAIIQAAVPQSITSFIYAKEYGLHPEVFSTAVIFGAIISLPILVAYYAALEFIVH
ncbi:auxin efflux carrier component 5 [Cucurbita maxima]|uniref:Auxin efflux carrier component n=1 Tax=Cucurbita maxima TaxID=3661 RepID=A0A6J1HQQ5_CUCMA|nr:auxin efflux carrier component 5 [Cucurbita maxima]